ncbi:carbohydrate kinase family protein [Thalassospira sp. TSL5-1]|uniref:carbohydrate kinase family protein n=1 Tax=Thalassospira sp. TSL5-1 TaxID=1544451 RepID=UPI000AEFC4EC|nr:carbohydrate kinase family protein [Thalassospira sp. TSL5-1]
MRKTPQSHKPRRPDPTREIISIGTINVDQLLGPVDHWPDRGTETVYPDYEMRVGGGGGIFGAALMALGAHQRMVVNIGDDEMGQWLKSQFGPLADHWHHSKAVTSVTIGLTHSDKERTFLSNEGHSALFDADMARAMLKHAELKGAIALLVGNFLMPRLVPDCTRLLGELRDAEAIVALDTAWPTGGWTDTVQDHLQNWLPLVDILLINEVEAAGLLGITIDDFTANVDAHMRAISPKLAPNGIVIVKRGSQGASACQNDHVLHAAPTEKINVIDTVGAGDCFNAGFLLAFQHGVELANCLHVGIEVAGKAIASHPRRYPALHDLNSRIRALLEQPHHPASDQITFDQVENA